MKFYLSVLIFILLFTDAYASWQTFQNDLRNTGSANGTGYFPLQTANFSDDSLGMDFQPLVEYHPWDRNESLNSYTKKRKNILQKNGYPSYSLITLQNLRDFRIRLLNPLGIKNDKKEFIEKLKNIKQELGIYYDN